VSRQAGGERTASPAGGAELDRSSQKRRPVFCLLGHAVYDIEGGLEGRGHFAILSLSIEPGMMERCL
jgi:hypothetical protein